MKLEVEIFRKTVKIDEMYSSVLDFKVKAPFLKNWVFFPLIVIIRLWGGGALHLYWEIVKISNLQVIKTIFILSLFYINLIHFVN